MYSPAPALSQPLPHGVIAHHVLYELLPQHAVWDDAVPLLTHELCSAQWSRVQVRQDRLGDVVQALGCKKAPHRTVTAVSQDFTKTHCQSVFHVYDSKAHTAAQLVSLVNLSKFYNAKTINQGVLSYISTNYGPLSMQAGFLYHISSNQWELTTCLVVWFRQIADTHDLH